MAIIRAGPEKSKAAPEGSFIPLPLGSIDDWGPYLFLCLFFLSFFLRLWVAIFRSLRFLPQGIQTPWAHSHSMKGTKVPRKDTFPMNLVFSMNQKWKEGQGGHLSENYSPGEVSLGEVPPLKRSPILNFSISV